MFFTRFVAGCIFPGLIVYAAGRKKFPKTVILSAILLCGFVNLQQSDMMTMFTGFACIGAMYAVPKKDLLELDRRITLVLQRAGFSGFRKEKKQEDRMNFDVENEESREQETRGPKTAESDSCSSGADAIPEDAITVTCPYCGAKIMMTGSRAKCQYCDSIVLRPEEKKATQEKKVWGRQTFERSTFENGTFQKTFTKVTFSDYTGESSQKSRTMALLLCFFLGNFGAHRFYAGRPISGVIYLLTFGGFTIGTMIDLIFLILGKFRDGKGEPILKWEL